MAESQEPYRRRVRDSIARNSSLLVSGGYSVLAACALLPILVQLQTDATGAYSAIIGVLGAIGGHLVANIAEGAYDSAQSENGEYDLGELASILDQQMRVNDQVSQALAMLVHQSGSLMAAADILNDLPERWDDFAQKLLDEVKGLSGTGVFIEYLRVDRLTLVRAERAPEADSLIVDYLRLLAETTDDLRLGTIDPTFETDTPIKLSQVYVPPRLAATSRAALLRGTETEDALELISDLIVRGGVRGIVLVGGPGAGKTAVTDRLTNSLALAILARLQSKSGRLDDRATGMKMQGWTAPLVVPVRVSLQEFAARSLPAGARSGSAGYLWEHILGRLRADALSDFAAPLNLILTGEMDLEGNRAERRGIGGLILLDGLDEVPAPQRPLVEQSIDQLGKRFSQSVVIVTCRAYSWNQARESESPDQESPLLEKSGYRVYQLAPFSQSQISLFVKRWYAAVQSLKHLGDEAVEQGIESLTAATRMRSLAPLAERPLLLTLMATLHTSRGGLPHDRATLYADSVQLLLEVWQKAKDLHVGGKVTVDLGLLEEFAVSSQQVERVLRGLAYDLQASEAPATREEQKRTRSVVTGDELRRAFRPLVADSWDTADRLVSYIQRRAGLLEWVGDEAYRFPHRTFQEFLAACHLLDEPTAPEALLNHFLREPAWWAEVLGLAVGRQSLVGYSQAVHTLDTAVRRADECVSKVQLFTTVLNAARDIALGERQDDSPQYRDLLHRIVAGYLEHASLTLDSRLARERGSVFADTLGTLIPHVLPFLDHPTAGDGAALYLGLYGGTELVPELIPRLAHRDSRVVTRAAHALGAIKDRRAAKPLAALCRKRRPRAAMIEVVRALGRIGGETAIGTLIDGVCAADAEIGHAAAEALGDMDDERAIPALHDRALESDLEAAPNIIHALSLIDSPEATKCLIELLLDEDLLPLARDALMESRGTRVQEIADAYHATDDYGLQETFRYILHMLGQDFLWREKDRDFTDQLITELAGGDWQNGA